MTLMLDMREQMDGWFMLDGGERQPIHLKLVASSPFFGRFTAPRPFKGTATLDATHETVPSQGMFTWFLAGPAYDFTFTSARLGHLRLAGQKHYTLRGLKESLITCPLRVYRDEACIGTGEIKYIQPISTFLLTAFRLRRTAAGSTAAASPAKL